jgi:LysM repeat protein
MKDCKNSLACLIKKELIRLTIVSTAAGVILFNQSLSLSPAGNGSLFDFNGQGFGGSSEEITEPGLSETINYYIGLASKKEYVGFESAVISPDSEIAGQDAQTDDEALVIINDSALFGSAGFSNGENITENRKAIITYEIQAGDTPSSIAEYFDISTNTLLWANNLTIADATRIKIGDKLMILPVNGVRHIIKKNETILSLAKKYSADAAKIMSFNGMKDGDVLEIDSVLVIPDGKMPVPPKPAAPKVTLALQNYGKNDQDLASLNEINTVAGDIHPPAHGRRFPWGQCTYYVALRRYVPWSGNANMWLRNAKAYGFETGNTPVVGAIVATSENPRYGHVAYVEAVGDGKITISEMNYVGLGIKSVRVLSVNNPVIKGYIYNAQ